MTENQVIDDQEKGLQKYLQGDKVIWMIVFILALISIPIIYSSTSGLAYRTAGGNTEYFMLKHAFLLAVSLGAAWICHRVDYIYYSRISRFALIISVPLLVAALLYGKTLNDASRWLSIPLTPFTFQPSDLAKLALVTNLASMLSRRQQSIQTDTKALFQVLFWCGLICSLISISDISSAALLFGTCMLVMYIGRVPFKQLSLMAVVGLAIAFTAYNFGQRGETADSRMRSFWDSENVPFQLEQSYVAFASGGATGVGVGQSVRKNFLPHAYSDFVYAIVGEEYGFAGALIVLVLFLVLLFRGMRVVSHTDRAFGGLLSAGLSLMIALQAITHMGVVVGLLPTTGLTLPFISMGGTSLIFTGITLGIILSVSREKGDDSEGTNMYRNRPKSL